MKKEKKDCECDMVNIDLIGRDDFVNRIINLIDTVKSQQSWSFAINGAWGSGKTFVVKQLKQKLKEDKTNIVVYYDAWKNDFYEDPLIAILYSILDELKEFSIKQEIMQGINNGVSAFINMLSIIPGVDRIKTIAKRTSDSLTNTQQEDKQFESYNLYFHFLKETQENIGQAIQGKKLIVLVDELDRCEVDYAMKVLNRLHHILNINNTFTIVAFNKDYFESIFGKDLKDDEKNIIFDKFFDMEYKLPSGRDNFIKNKCINLLSNEKLNTKMLNILCEISNKYLDKMNIREIEQTFQKISFVLKSIQDDECSLPLKCVYFILALDICCQNRRFVLYKQSNIADLVVKIRNGWSLAIYNDIVTEVFDKNADSRIALNISQMTNVSIYNDKDIQFVIGALAYLLCNKNIELYTICNYYNLDKIYNTETLELFIDKVNNNLKILDLIRE